MPDLKPHRIRLRGPWSARVVKTLSDADQNGHSCSHSDSHMGESFRCTIPGTWATDFGENFCGVVELQRSFNCPTGLTNDQTVTLTVERVDDNADVMLNDRALGHIGKDTNLSVDIRSLLKSHNRLVVTVVKPFDPTVTKEDANCTGPIGDAYLEIYDSIPS